MRKIAFIVFFACLALPVVAQPNHHNWMVRAFHSQDGLPYEVIRDFSWDRGNPEIWMATWSGGVARFDGLHCQILAPSTGFPFDSIRTISVVGPDKAWIGADSGFAYFDQGRVVEFSRKKIPSLPDQSCFSTLQVSEDEVWVGTQSGYIYAVSAEIPAGASPGWRVVVGPEVTKGSEVREILKDHQGRIWVANNNTGILCYENNSWRIALTYQDLKGDCQSISEAPDGSIWAIGKSLLIRIGPEKWEVVHTSPLFLTAVAITPHGLPVVGTSKGLYIFQDQQWQKITLDPESPELYVETISCQDEIIWVGTRTGAFRLSPTPWTKCAETENGASLIGGTLVAQPDQPPLALSENNELMRFDGTIWRPMLSLPSHELTSGCITKPHEGSVWILSGSDVYQCSLDPPTLLRKIPAPDNSDPRSIYQDNRRALWLLTSHGLFRLENDSWIPEPSGQQGYLREKALSLSQLTNGDYWVGYEERAERWHEKQITAYPIRGEVFFGAPPISTILEARDHRILFGTPSSGLVILDTRNNWHHLTEKEGLARNRIFTLYQDSRDTIWVGHRDIGISFQYHNLWIAHKYMEGLPTGSIESIGEYPAGRMWASLAENQILTYKPSSDPPETTLLVKDLELSEKKSGIITFQGKDLWNQTLSRDLFYSFRIVPKNQALTELGWSPFSQETEVMVPLLPPGNYLLQVRCLDKDGNLDPTPASTTLTVNPPIWQKWEFFFPVMLLSLISLVALAAFFRKHIAMIDSEERYRTLVDNALTVILKWDSRERITYWNEYGEEILGFSAEEAIGSLVQDILFSNSTEDRQAFHEIREKLKGSKGQTVHRRSEHKSRDGHTVHLSWTYRAVLDNQGHLLEIHAFGSDCTEQVKVENALTESEQKYRTLVEQASDSILILQDGVVKYSNPQLAVLLGYAPDAVLDKPFLEYVDPKDRDKVKSYYSRRLAGEAVPETYEITIRDILGRPIETETHANLILYQGHPASLVLLRDITTRKQAQEALLKSSRMEATATLAGGIAHDFNNLMVGILGYSELMRMDFQDRPDIIRMLDRVIQSAERAGELSQQMLSYARGGKYHPQEIDLNHIVSETIRQRAKSFPDGLRLESHLCPDLPRITADPVQVSEVVIGLLNNAVEALADGGIVTIETSSQSIGSEPDTQLSLPGGSHLVLTVTDNGCGMDPETLTRIFEPFYTTKFQGRGLGLAAVYGIVKNHGGEITVESEKGHGTTFKVFFPTQNN